MAQTISLGLVAILGLFATSSSLLGAAIGLYMAVSKRLLACILAFSAGALVSALAIELAFEGAQDLHRHAYSTRFAWAFIGSGFAAGAIFYYVASLILEQKGGAVRYRTRFREYARDKMRAEAKDTIELLARCDLLRHLPPEEIEHILPCVQRRHLEPGEILFHAGNPGDALFIVAAGTIAIVAEGASVGDAGTPEHKLAELGPGQAFGEMALLSGDTRSATARAVDAVDLLEIGRDDFERLVAADPRMADAVARLSHGRAISNLSAGGPDPAKWARIAAGNLEHMSHGRARALLTEAGHGAGMAIVLGNILDTIPGCLVIGAKFSGFASLSLTLILGMFLGGIPEAAASATMLRQAGYRPPAVFGLWSTVLVAGIVAAVAGKLFIGDAESPVAIYCQALAGGAVLALISHAMIPEAIDQGGSLVVLPTVAGFLFALYLAMAEAFG